ncbi:PstS family phosphate ABC transporter substrate-binding protein [Kitasatospora sp. GAS204B]|uniref:PstS family phosphate ABC transporter substrate-binding protein n=1 Tax=unclassified Kitasatospora TaxID=2633591 RepID=UPI0024765A7E|nr:substrate-binding domain-containing protein [Kitasatospora sp. GAS204B]MDH6119527.1 ABC-type phosphate transport system substrate-binding protein [Kitasatospora sp. GAS204B]
MRHTAAKLFATVAIAASLATVAAGQATADPTVTPAAQDIVGTGSDTIQAVLNQFSTDYNASLTAAHDTTSPRLYSWDATPAGNITPKTGASTIARPNGSGGGISALNNNTHTTVDFARSSRGPQSTDPSTDDFVAFAQDGVAWAGNSTGNAPANLTTADLKGIYSCTITNWNQITDVSGYTGPNATIKAYIPQLNSGTRAFFLTAINGGTTALTPGSCVQSYTPEENEGTDSVFTDANVIFPYSAAHYIGQTVGGHTTTSDAPGSLTLRSVDGVNPIASNALNPTFTGSNYGRTVYNVVRDSEFNGTGTQATALQNIFGASGWICNDSTAAADIASYGFAALPAFACGAVVHS